MRRVSEFRRRCSQLAAAGGYSFAISPRFLHHSEILNLEFRMLHGSLASRGADQRYILGLRRPHQLAVKRRQRKPTAPRQFEIGGIVRGEPEAVAQAQRRQPGLPVGAAIDRDRQCAQIG